MSHDTSGTCANAPSVTYFKNFYNDHIHLAAYRTEWMIWDKELKFAEEFEGIGHWTQQQIPNEVNELIIKFLREVS